jgi:hypothetical protein
MNVNENPKETLLPPPNPVFAVGFLFFFFSKEGREKVGSSPSSHLSHPWNRCRIVTRYGIQWRRHPSSLGLMSTQLPSTTRKRRNSAQNRVVRAVFGDLHVETFEALDQNIHDPWRHLTDVRVLQRLQSLVIRMQLLRQVNVRSP